MSGVGAELIVEGRHFPAMPAVLAVSFAQSLADQYEREVVVYERSGGTTFPKERCKPTIQNWGKL